MPHHPRAAHRALLRKGRPRVRPVGSREVDGHGEGGIDQVANDQPAHGQGARAGPSGAQRHPPTD